MMMVTMISRTNANSCRPNAPSSPVVGSMISATAQNITLYLCRGLDFDLDFDFDNDDGESDLDLDSAIVSLFVLKVIRDDDVKYQLKSDLLEI